MNALKVARKEGLEMIRDKRIRVAFIMPIVVVYMMIQLFGFIEHAATSAKNQKLYYVQSDNPIVKQFSGLGAQLESVPSKAAGEQMIRDGKIGVVLDFGPSPTTEKPQETITAYYDPQKDTSQITIAGLAQLIQAESKNSVVNVLIAHNLSPVLADPIKLDKREVKVGSTGAGQVIVSILPYLIVLFSFTGGASLSSDLVAGEKDKNTLETLLITPVSRTEIVLGKFIALSIACLGGCLTAMLGLFLAGTSAAASKSEMFKGGFGITLTSGLTILILMIPLVMFFASILLAVSTYAKNSREAQTYLALVNILVILPAVFSQVIGLTDFGSKMWINLVPILNTANNVRNALLGRTDPIAVAITVGISLVVAAIAIRIAIWLFNREQVLIRV